MSGMVLHLPDGPEGATVGDDSSCGGPLSTEGGTDAFLDVVGNARGGVTGCLVQLEAPDVFIDSVVVSFPSTDLARLAITTEGFTGLVRYYGLDCCNGEPLGALMPRRSPGDDTIAAASRADTSAIVGWRVGALIGAVAVIRMDHGSGATSEAERLASIQHERMLHPLEVADDVDDDRLVGLDQATFTPWWIGSTFAPAGFAPIELYMSSYQPGMVDLDYLGVRIQVFDLNAVQPGSQPDQMLDVASELFDSPCTVTELIAGPGEARLIGRYVPDEFFGPAPPGQRTGWGQLNSDDCPPGAPNVWMATVEVDHLYIRINPPFCYNCLTGPNPDLPYQTPVGLKAIVATLEPYVA